MVCSKRRFFVSALVLFGTWAMTTYPDAPPGVTYEEAAVRSGIDYRRSPSASKALFDAIKRDPPYSPRKRDATPLKAWGAPGVALIDDDRDGDLDLYVTNGPGTPNSLFRNQLVESGELTFVDMAESAGVAAADLDATGVCFGDLDNDGDPDLLVLSHNAANRLFENLGDGTYRDITVPSGLAAADVRASSGCSFGDVDGDGLLDIAIGNTYDNWEHLLGLNVERFALNQHNRLWLSSGGNRFLDASAISGIERLAGFPAGYETAASLTWAIALVDLDLDGDVDLVHADDQSGFPPFEDGGVDRGLIHIFENDGAGRFIDVTLEVLGRKHGAWMGLAFGDFDCNGRLDLFATNLGDYAPGFPQPAGRRASRWFLGQPDGVWSDPGVGELGTTPFGWGTSAFDHDNDGDLDLVYHGGLDLGIAIEASNAGVLLHNEGCTARFTYPRPAMRDHRRRTVHGMAVGDLDRDGWVDVVSVSNFDIPEEVELVPHAPVGSPFDAVARYHPSFLPDPKTGELAWTGSTFEPGTLSIELARPDPASVRHGSAEIRLVGSAGRVRGARVNRDGIGAVVRFRPAGGAWTMRPVTGGSSYASQDALPIHFGLGTARRGTVEVLWPGGVRNRLVNVRAGERLIFPEIPCSFDDASLPEARYLGCLLRAFDDLEKAGVLQPGERARFLAGALEARAETLGPACTSVTAQGSDHRR